MIQPPHLTKGDTIGIVAPSRMITREQMTRAYEVFESWGLNVVDGSSLYDSHGYFAGTDQGRIDELQYMINNDSVRAIFCARGGYGMTRIIDALNFEALHKHPKWIVGFSDITALHCALSREGLESIHGVMPVQYDYMGIEDSLESLKNLLFEDESPPLSASPNKHNRNGKGSGILTGGNLSLVADSIGSSTEIETEGKLLFLEEIDEYLYKIDRMLIQLKRAGKLDQLAGLIIGNFSDMKDTQIKFGVEIEELIANQFSEYDYPIAFGFSIGHEPHNLAIPCGRTAELDVSLNGSLLKF